jgi:hypothetical protein
MEEYVTEKSDKCLEWSMETLPLIEEDSEDRICAPSRPSSGVITVLKTEQASLPIYWSHYASYHAIVKHTLQRLKEAAQRMEAGFSAMPNISEEEFKWTTFSLWVIDHVRLKYLDDSKALDMQ